MTNIASLRRYQFILLPISLGLFAASLVIPWVTITFLGTFPFSPITIAGELYSHGTAVASYKNTTAANSPVLSSQGFDLIGFISSYRTSFTAFVISFILYLAAFGAVILAIVKKSRRSIIAISAGILAISSGLFCLGALESLKISFAKVAAESGGIIGGEFKGNEGAIADSIIGIGSGPYVTVVIGVLSISYSSIERIKTRKDASP